MTAISSISGLNISSVDKYTVASKPFYHLESISEGELNTMLLSRQLELVGAATGDEGFIQAAKALEANIGVNSISGLNQYSQFARRQKSKYWPAMSATYFTSGIGQPQSFSQWQDEEKIICERIKQEWRNTSWLRFSKRTQLKKEWMDCFDRLGYISNLNANLEGSAYHPLYEFASPGDRSSNNTVGTKSVLHRNFVSSISEVTGLSRESVRLWLRNGALASAIERDLGAMQPEEAINTMRTEVPREGVGGLLTVLGVIFSIVKAALAIAQTLIQAFSDPDRARILAASEAVGTPTWGPEKYDWQTGSFSNLLGPTGNNALLYGAIAAGVAYYLT